VHDLLDDGGDVVAVADVGEQDQELVAALPADRVGVAGGAAQAVGEGLQQGVAAGWPRLSLMCLKWSRSSSSRATGSRPAPRGRRPVRPGRGAGSGWAGG
jgi:hypothetical protein